jgi:glutamine synthetase type III
MLGILEFFFAPFRDRLFQSYFDKRSKHRQQLTQLCTAALTRIQRERPNFQHIVAGNGYRNEAHRRAVEETSFELLRDSIASLQNLRRLKKSASSLLEQIDTKNAAGALAAVDRLEPKLNKLVRP